MQHSVVVPSAPEQHTACKVRTVVGGNCLAKMATNLAEDLPDTYD